MVTAPAQLSVALTEAILAVGTADAQLYVMADGVPLITGAVLSYTVIVCVCADELPQASVAIYVLAML